MAKKKPKGEDPRETLKKLTAVFRKASETFDEAAKLTGDLARSLKEANEKQPKDKKE